MLKRYISAKCHVMCLCMAVAYLRENALYRAPIKSDLLNYQSYEVLPAHPFSWIWIFYTYNIYLNIFSSVSFLYDSSLAFSVAMAKANGFR